MCSRSAFQPKSQAALLRIVGKNDNVYHREQAPSVFRRDKSIIEKSNGYVIFTLEVVVVLECLVFFAVKKIANDIRLCVLSVIVFMPVFQLCTSIWIRQQTRDNIAQRHYLHRY
ncbi:hypothetical protein [Parasitella parasitica]|uniref:Uncharacterized protein n=1 Tax=Parasitella parasitica TaxID=35722 RepID=A0A0B7N4D3_9FUNG|nr:hypothetical protein [Parasitella parasitica]